MHFGLRIIPIILFGSLSLLLAQEKPTRSLPDEPEKQLKSFRLADEVRIELVAREPQIVDPVAMAFDEFGRLYVCEMRGYPNGGVATGNPLPGRVVRLEDLDEAARFRKRTVIAEGLRVPNSVMPYDGGVFVSDAPSIYYIKNGEKKTILTGFDLANIQQLPNGLQWALDNRIHALGGGGGNLSSPTDAKFKPLTLRGRGFSFDPQAISTFQPTSGGGQFGLTSDDWGNWFTATNSQHLRQIVLPDHYLARNPFLTTLQTTLDIPEHGAACKVYRVSPFEAWRVERTTRRKDDPNFAKRLPPTELVPGGFITSACSPLIYRADWLPESYYGLNFVCDPANNIIHREKLEAKGSIFVAKRIDTESEFLASTDNWFRPCCLTLGPDGAIYIADICREVIETPLSLPKDIQDRYDLTTRETGRIWRIVPKTATYSKPKMPGEMSRDELVQQLESPNAWRRLTAQRLLIEKKDREATKPLLDLLSKTKSSAAKVHLLWTLHGLQSLPDDSIIAGLNDAHAGVRKQALILAEGRLKNSELVRLAALKLAGDPDSHVRFQAALSLGELPEADAALALGKLLSHPESDSWLTTAVMSSSRGKALDLLKSVLSQTETKEQFQTRREMISRLVTTAGRSNGTPILELFQLAVQLESRFQLDGAETILEGLVTTGADLDTGWNRLKIDDAAGYQRLMDRFAKETELVRDSKAPLASKQRAIRRLSLAPSATVLSLLPELLTPQQAPEMVLTTIQALGRIRISAASPLLSALPKLNPASRKAAIDLLLSRRESTLQLLEAMEKDQVASNSLDPTQLVQLRDATDAVIRDRARKLLGAASSRQKVIDGYAESLKLAGDSTSGKAIFKANCVSCHRLDNEGVNLGADLQAALGNYTAEKLLVAILDPSREVDSRFVQYSITTTDGRTLVGVLASETATSITLRQPDKPDTALLRSDIESLKASTKSLMPEGLEAKIPPQAMADLIQYLLKR
jgi:putative membrane-bound dehydrogenase-like protein